jgi:replicative DNA helicase
MQNREAERAALAAFMLAPGALAEVQDILEPGDFYEPRHQAIYRAALSLDAEGKGLDPVTLNRELERQDVRVGDGLEYLADLTLSTPSATNVRAHAGMVRDCALRRRLAAAAQRAAEVAADPSLTADEAAEIVEQRALEVRQLRGSSDARPVAVTIRETWGHIERVIGAGRFVTGTPTGYSELDRATQGLQPGELVILAARPSVGKTAMALCLARNAAVQADVPVAVFSLEMSREALNLRLLCSEAHVDSFLLKTGQADAAAFTRIARAVETLASAPLWIDDTPALTLAALRSRARRLKGQHGVGLVVIDYLQLMRAGRRHDSAEAEVSEISRGLKAMAKELHVPVLALSQLSRESERRTNRRPQLSDLRSSGAIEQDADVVLFLYREGMHNPEIDQSRTQLIVAKNRNGPVRDIELVFVAEQTAFREPYRGGLSSPRARVVRDITESAGSAEWPVASAAPVEKAERNGHTDDAVVIPL